MKLIYVTNARIPSRSSNSIQIMSFVSALATYAPQVELLAPRYSVEAPEGYGGDIWNYYGVRQNFVLRKTGGLISSRDEHFKVMSILKRWVGLTRSIARVLARPEEEPIHIYGRGGLPIACALVARAVVGHRAHVSIAMELHDLPTGRHSATILRHVDGFVVITNALKDDIESGYPWMRRRPIIVARDGYNADMWTAAQSAPSARERICAAHGLDAGRPVVVYTGRLNQEKGSRLILECARQLRESPVQFLLVGKVYDQGMRDAIIEEGLDNVVLTGFVPPANIADYLRAADILLLPSTSQLSYSKYTSPLKLFEYWASGKPVIVSDLPAIREVAIDRVNCLVASSTQASEWADSVNTLLRHPALATAIGQAGQRGVLDYSYERRAESVLRFLESLARAAARGET